VHGAWGLEVSATNVCHAFVVRRNEGKKRNEKMCKFLKENFQGTRNIKKKIIDRLN